MTVKATREGLIGSRTASGYVIDRATPFVALPSRSALYRFVRLTNPANGKTALAIVLDVGPWNVADEDYVFGGKRPAAESGRSLSGHGTNGAGIDLSQAIWAALDMVDNSLIDWEFIA